MKKTEKLIFYKLNDSCRISGEKGKGWKNSKNAADAKLECGCDVGGSTETTGTIDFNYVHKMWMQECYDDPNKS